MTKFIKNLRFITLRTEGVCRYFPAIFSKPTVESDAWTQHRAFTLGNKHNSDSKSESHKNRGGAMASGYPEEEFGKEKSDESIRDWEKYWIEVALDDRDGFTNATKDWKKNAKSENEETSDNESKQDKERRWIFALRHAERVDLTYGSDWVKYCFDKNGTYKRLDLNMPVKLAERAGGAESYAKDTPLTRVGRLQAQLVGEGLRLAGITVKHVYASAALRCVETAHCFLQGLKADPSVKIRVEPALFEGKLYHMETGMAFMTPRELYEAGLNVDLNHKPFLDLDITTSETIDECYRRGEKVTLAAIHETEKEGGNIIFVGHASVPDATAIALKRLANPKTEYPPYKLHKDVLGIPYCALGAMRDKPWEVVRPPCPPLMHSSCGKYNWKMLLKLQD